MKIEDWFEWPTRSTDPAANAAIALLLVITAITLFAFGVVIGLRFSKDVEVEGVDINLHGETVQ